MGGFVGRDPAPTGAQLRDLVADGDLRFVLLGGRGGPSRGGSDDRTQWVQANCALVDPAAYGSQAASSGGGQQLYDVARGAALVLAGHTHGGQVSLPFIGAPYTLRADPRVRAAAGMQRLGRGVLHISTGLGHTTPLRFNCPPEATWIECIPSASVPRLADAGESPHASVPPEWDAVAPAHRSTEPARSRSRPATPLRSTS